MGSAPPRIRVAPAYAETDGDLAADFAQRFGLVLDGWQAAVIDDWLARDGELWASRTCGLAVPRQNGKNVIVEARELYGMVVLGEKFLHSAHEVATAKKHFQRLLYFFGEKPGDPDARFPELNRLVKHVRRVNGEEGMWLVNGGSVEISARTKSAKRGYSVDGVVYDESQQCTEEALEALNGTNSASRNPQWIYLGTPPGPLAQGEIFRRQRKLALDGGGSRCWQEWSVTGDIGVDFDIHDSDTHRATNPAYGYRVTAATIEQELADLSPTGFARERVGWWGPDDTAPDELFSAAKWAEMASPGPPHDQRPAAIGIDMSHDRLIAVAACWHMPDDSTHVELLATDYAEDTHGTVDWVANRAKRVIPVVIDQYSPAASMATALQRRGVKVVVTSSGAQMARACGLFMDDLGASVMTHADQKQLSDALAGAKRRKIGDAGGFGVDRRDPDQNIAPLVAAILARYGATLKRKPSMRGERRVSVI